MPQLWLIEGVPGSGKTSAARKLTVLCNAGGLRARSWLEEAKDHPVLPSSLRKQSAGPDFPARCVAAFKSFVQTEEGVLILEGAAFQSTIRFMFAAMRSPIEIKDYLSIWADAVRPATPRVLMFEVQDAWAHYEQFVAAERGAAWMARLVAYVESTPVAQAQNWRGVNGLIKFWAAYQELCLASAADLPWPILVMKGWSETQRFHERSALQFFLGRRPGWKPPLRTV